jgi:hypothetical protein
MWRVAGLAIVVSCAAGGACAADTAGAQALAAAAFVAPPVHAAEPALALANHSGFAGAVTEWRSSETPLPAVSGRAVNSLRVSLAEPSTGHRRMILPPRLAAPENAYEVSLVRNWPAAVAFQTRRFGLDVTPHAGLGMSNQGGLAEAGATVRLSPRKREDLAVERLKALGVRDGAGFGDRGRWYLFAAASGRAVGLNMLRGDGGWNRAGWTTDPTSKLVGDAQLGVGWRRGAMQTSVGFIHREVRGEHMILGQETKPDSLVAVSFSVRPRQ